MSLSSQFFKYQAQTTPHPIGLQVRKARGCYVYDHRDRRYLDFIAGVSACNLGHRHPKVSRAITRQMQKYGHVMVYGEFVQRPQVLFARRMADLLPDHLNTVYPTNSGAEAIEGSMKLAKRFTGRSKIISCFGAYHGSTQGALTLMGNEKNKQSYRPLIPGVAFIRFNDLSLDAVDRGTAAVFVETIQGGAGFILPQLEFLQALRDRCTQMGALLIFDEVQSGFGRTGKLFAFEHYGVVPDVLVVGKAMANGFPCGAFITDRHMMGVLKEHPKLGHITTFGGHPVVLAAACETLSVLLKTGVMDSVKAKEMLFRKLLNHPKIIEIRGIGLMLCIVFECDDVAARVARQALKNGVILFFLLFKGNMLRITPPLTVTTDQIRRGCKLILKSIEEVA